MNRLTSKVAVVTGASRAVSAIAPAFAAAGGCFAVNIYGRANTMNELWRLSASEVARLVRARKVSAGDVADVWDAQFLMRAFPAMGLPGLTVSTGLVGTSPVGVQIVAARYREDLCLCAGDTIEARGTPPAAIDPATSTRIRGS